jgi:hypothetical protein
MRIIETDVAVIDDIGPGVATAVQFWGRDESKGAADD